MAGGETDLLLHPGGFLYRKDLGSEEVGGFFCGHLNDAVWRYRIGWRYQPTDKIYPLPDVPSFTVWHHPCMETLPRSETWGEGGMAECLYTWTSTKTSQG